MLSPAWLLPVVAVRPLLPRLRAAFLLVLQAGKSGLTLLMPQCLMGKPCMEAVAAKP
jgi:hypothetical protein